MPTLTFDRAIDAPPELAWAVVTDHQLYGDLAPNLARVDVVSGETDDLVRQCVDTDGNEWTETCTDWTTGRRFRVRVDVPNSDFHRRFFRRFEGEWAVVDRPDDVLVTTTFDFDTRYGPLGTLLGKYFAYRAPGIVEPIYDGWEAEIEDRLAALDEQARSRDGGTGSVPSETDADRGGTRPGPANGLGR